MYNLYKSQLIVDNQSEMVDQIHQCHQVHQSYFKNKDSTWTYSEYNFFILSSPSLLFSKLFQELKTVINDYIPGNLKWIQCWYNYHHSDEVLDWHNHLADYHGYISIDPKNTKTIFRDNNPILNYEIVNEVGNIYIGPGHREHKVVVNEEYCSPRITLGFDIYVYKEGRPTHANSSLSLMPL